MPQMQQTRQTPNAKRNSGYAYRAMTQTHRMLPTHNLLIFNKKRKHPAAVYPQDIFVIRLSLNAIREATICG